MIEGSNYPLLEHASGCDGREFCTCEAVPLPDRADPEEPDIMVVYLEWCGECGAADFEIVGSV